MENATIEIVPYKSIYREQILALSVRAWEPVFPLMQNEMQDYVYEAFYPKGWKVRQLSDIDTTLLDDNTKIWVALTNGELSGYVGLKVHQEDCMGEVYIIAVDPDYQRQGISTALLEFSFEWMKQQGLSMVMVETGGDKGHAPSRATYESAGFEQLQIARYFRKL